MPRAASELQEIPGVGPKIAVELGELGVRSIAALRRRDPEVLYRQLCKLRGVRVDPCVLYVLRCAVCYAGNSTHDPNLLKWWNWKSQRKQAAPSDAAIHPRLVRGGGP